jgi:hypothetical protein
VVQQRTTNTFVHTFVPHAWPKRHRVLHAWPKRLTRTVTVARPTTWPQNLRGAQLARIYHTFTLPSSHTTWAQVFRSPRGACHLNLAGTPPHQIPPPPASARPDLWSTRLQVHLLLSTFFLARSAALPAFVQICKDDLIYTSICKLVYRFNAPWF